MINEASDVNLLMSCLMTVQTFIPRQNNIQISIIQPRISDRYTQRKVRSQMTAVRVCHVFFGARKRIFALIVSNVEMNSLKAAFFCQYIICVFTLCQIIMTSSVCFCVLMAAVECVCSSWFTLERNLNLILVKIC